MIELLENIKSINGNLAGSIAGVIAPDGKSYQVEPYYHLEFMKTLLKDEYEKNWIDGFQDQIESVRQEIMAEACQDGGGYHYVDFYDTEQEGNLMERLYGLGFFRFYAVRVNSKIRGEYEFRINIEGSKKMVGNITNLIADLKTKFEDKITIKVETT
jgi:hypothetical protein